MNTKMIQIYKIKGMACKDKEDSNDTIIAKMIKSSIKGVCEYSTELQTEYAKMPGGIDNIEEYQEMWGSKDEHSLCKDQNSLYFCINNIYKKISEMSEISENSDVMSINDFVTTKIQNAYKPAEIYPINNFTTDIDKQNEINRNKVAKDMSKTNWEELIGSDIDKENIVTNWQKTNINTIIGVLLSPYMNGINKGMSGVKHH